MEYLLWGASWRSALLAALIALVLRGGRIRSAQAQHLIWLSVLLTMLALPFWLGLGLRLSLPVFAPLPQGTIFNEPAVPDALPPLPEARNARTQKTNPPIVATLEPQPSTTATMAWTWPWPRLAFAVYLLGLAIVLARLLSGVWQARQLVRHAQPCATVGADVWESRACASPVTVGWLRPRIVLPANETERWQSWPAQKLDAVLIHERAHIQRHDPLIHLLALVNRAVFWFHPLAWWLARKLSDLAETACDAAVLQRGHAQADYAEYLIELARSVQQAGRRVRMPGTAMADGSLATRIEHILQGLPSTSLSRWRAGALALTSLALIVLVAACQLVQKQKPAAGQASMNEQLHKRAEEHQQGERERQALEAEVKQLTPEQAQALLDQIKADPSDKKRVLKLVRYYQHKVDVPRLVALTHWFIEHQPETIWAWNINPAWDQAGYDKGKALWLAHLKRKPVAAAVYRNAARYLEGGDKPLAEQILLEAQQVHPEAPQTHPLEKWSMDLGMHYAQVLLGSVGPVAEYNVLRELSMAEAHGKYAQAVRAKLAQATDADVLLQTAQYMGDWGSRWAWRKDNPLDFDVLAPAQLLNEHALTLQPASEKALRQKFRLDEMATALRLRNLAIEQLSPADRMRKLRNELSSLRPNQTAEAENKARQLLALAQQQPHDPEASNAIYRANLVLGQRALQRNDKRQAAQHLLAASAVTPTDWFRYEYVDMTLARQLVDWGEREAVAQYLERFAPINQARGAAMTQWAVQLRQGLNPDLLPFTFN
jgi:beta-lactamase regulating signal transducer with metallopeptidase domain